MSDQERLIALGEISENEAAMKAMNHGVARACQEVRNTLVSWAEPGDINIDAINAAVSDLTELVQKYRTLAAKTKLLKDRYGVK